MATRYNSTTGKGSGAVRKRSLSENLETLGMGGHKEGSLKRSRDLEKRRKGAHFKSSNPEGAFDAALSKKLKGKLDVPVGTRMNVQIKMMEEHKRKHKRKHKKR
jgi:hypothetical protein